MTDRVGRRGASREQPEHRPVAASMLFTNHTDRATYLQSLADGDHVPVPGDALRHARGTNIGVWGDAERLQLDCLKVLVHEVREASFCPEFLPPADELIERCRYSNAWRVAFTHARHEQDQRLEAVVASLSGSDARDLPVPDGIPGADFDVARSILDELGLD